MNKKKILELLDILIGGFAGAIGTVIGVLSTPNFSEKGAILFLIGMVLFIILTLIIICKIEKQLEDKK